MFNRIVEMYQKTQLGINEICRSCNQDSKQKGLGRISKPLSVYHIGDNYIQNQKYRILFVGKNARGTSRHVCEGWPHVNDARKGRYSSKNLFFEYSTPFWRYTKDIACKVFDCPPEEAFKLISITNLIKCNNATFDEGCNFDGTFRDCTTERMKDNCLNRIKTFWGEVGILNPTHIIIYSHYNYDEYLETFPPSYSLKIKGDKEKERDCGAKSIRWWHREYKSEGIPQMKVLVTSHP